MIGPIELSSDWFFFKKKNTKESKKFDLGRLKLGEYPPENDPTTSSFYTSYITKHIYIIRQFIMLSS